MTRFLNWFVCLFRKPQIGQKFAWTGEINLIEAANIWDGYVAFMRAGDTITWKAKGIPGSFTATALISGPTDKPIKVGLNWNPA